MTILKISLVSFLLISFIDASSQNKVEIIFESATYRPKSNPYQFSIKTFIKNNSNDTIRIIKPTTSQFKASFKNPGTLYIGEEEKPYEIIFNSEGLCDGDKTFEKENKKANVSFLREKDLFIIPPGEKSKSIYASFFVNKKICPEIKPMINIVYDPNYRTLQKDDKVFLEKSLETLNKLIDEANTFVKNENIDTEYYGDRKPTSSYVLQSYKITKVTYENKIESKQINLEIKK